MSESDYGKGPLKRWRFYDTLKHLRVGVSNRTKIDGPDGPMGFVVDRIVLGFRKVY